MNAELWTITQCAEYCKCTPAAYTRYVTYLRAPGPIYPEPGHAGESLYDTAAVRAYADERTGRGSGADRSAAYDIAVQAIADRDRYGYPEARNRDTAEYTTPDGIKITFRWQQDMHAIDKRNARMDWVHAEYAVAAKQFSYISLVDDLSHIIREARKAQAKARVILAATEAMHAAAVRALSDAADRVDTEHALPGRYGYPTACEQRRHLIRQAVAARTLRPEEIAAAARVDIRDL